jgi:UDPglucose 6-dehydrogenase
MRIAVIGTGHVGLVAAAGLAESGNDVTCVGIDATRVERILAGDFPLFEPGLEALTSENLAAGRLAFTTDLEGAVRAAEVVLIALRIGIAADGSADLTELFAVADRIGKSLDAYKVIALKSTVPVGTADRLSVRIGAHGSIPFAVASNPAFLKEGDALDDFMKPARVVIGTSDARAAEILRRLYAPFVRTMDRILIVDPRTAELSKYAASALLAARISFMNELALLCDEIGADIEMVRAIMGADPRIGPKSLFVGPGFGGTDFQNDISMLLTTGRDAGQPLSVLSATHEANQRQKTVLLQKLTRALGELEGKVVAVWGLAFKPSTSDIGQAPALSLIDALLGRGAVVRAHDPQAIANAKNHYGARVTFSESMYEATEGADALVLVTEWHPYRRPDFERIARVMRGKVLIDGRNVWEPEELREKGLRYIGLGRGSRPSSEAGLTIPPGPLSVRPLSKAKAQ